VASFWKAKTKIELENKEEKKEIKNRILSVAKRGGILSILSLLRILPIFRWSAWQKSQKL